VVKYYQNLNWILKNYLTELLSECNDFKYEKYEKLAMQKLVEYLSSLHNCQIELLITLKYHCKLAGKRIEYAWGLFKKYFHWTAHAEKRQGSIHIMCGEQLEKGLCRPYLKILCTCTPLYVDIFVA